MAFCNHDDDLASSKPYQDRKMEVCGVMHMPSYCLLKMAWKPRRSTRVDTHHAFK